MTLLLHESGLVRHGTAGPALQVSQLDHASKLLRPFSCRETLRQLSEPFLGIRGRKSSIRGRCLKNSW